MQLIWFLSVSIVLSCTKTHCLHNSWRRVFWLKQLIFRYNTQGYFSLEKVLTIGQPSRHSQRYFKTKIRGVGLAFYDTKVWTHHRIRLPAVIKETSFLKSASWSTSKSGCWKIAKYWCCSALFDTFLNNMEWID